METPYPYLILGTRTTWNYLSFIALCKSSNNFLFAMSVPAILHCLSRFKHLKILHSKKSKKNVSFIHLLSACLWFPDIPTAIYLFFSLQKTNKILYALLFSLGLLQAWLKLRRDSYRTEMHEPYKEKSLAPTTTTTPSSGYRDLLLPPEQLFNGKNSVEDEIQSINFFIFIQSV